jgi:hypothetical protein
MAHWVWSTDVAHEKDLVEGGVTRSAEFNVADMWLRRKPDWILPGEPACATMNLTHEEIYARGLVQWRAPHVLPELDGLRGLNNEVAEKCLALMANILREYSGDLLRGDFTQLGAQRATMYDDAPPREPAVTL